MGGRCRSAVVHELDSGRGRGWGRDPDGRRKEGHVRARLAGLARVLATVLVGGSGERAILTRATLVVAGVRAVHRHERARPARVAPAVFPTGVLIGVPYKCRKRTDAYVSDLRETETKPNRKTKETPTGTGKFRRGLQLPSRVRSKWAGDGTARTPPVDRKRIWRTGLCCVPDQVESVEVPKLRNSHDALARLAIAARVRGVAPTLVLRARACGGVRGGVYRAGSVVVATVREEIGKGSG